MGGGWFLVPIGKMVHHVGRSPRLREVRGRAITVSAAIAALGLPTIHNRDFATTDMVASLLCARARMTGEADLLIVYGDIVFEPRIARAVLAAGAPVATAIDRAWLAYWRLRMPDPLADAETLRLGAGGRILEIGGRPGALDEIEGQYMGLTNIRADHAPRLVRAWDELAERGAPDRGAGSGRGRSTARRGGDGPGARTQDELAGAAGDGRRALEQR